MPRNLWNDQDAAARPELDGLVYRSNILGCDRAVVNIYGGNTSAKLMLVDHMGRPTRVLAVKASGSDVLTIKAGQFALLKLGEIDPLFERESMTDEEMTDYLSRTVFEPGRPRQSIETLLHAFVPATHVDHTHPDVVISIACAPDGEAAARDLWGERMAWVPYIRPGFTLSKWIGGKVRDNPKIECVVMGKHGLVTWGPDSKTCYDNTIRIIQEAEDYVREKAAGKRVFGAVKVPPLDAEQRRAIAARVMPVIRGAVSDRRSTILCFDDSEPVLDFVSYERTPQVSQIGAACPDHLVHVKRQPLFVDWQPGDGVEALLERLPAQLADYKARYAEYFEAHRSDGDEMADPAPRVILIPGVGMINTGKDAQNADVSRQLYHRAVAVIAGSEALGGFDSLTPAEAFAIEYWPLELYKLKLAPPDRDLAGKVALITGAASGIGAATARLFAREGARLVLTDVNEAGAKALAAEIGQGAIGFEHDVTKEAAWDMVMAETSVAFGRLDVLVNNAGIGRASPILETSYAQWREVIAVNLDSVFLGCRAGIEAMKETGGSIINVSSILGLVGSAMTAAYSASKGGVRLMTKTLALEVAQNGWKIRINSVHPGYIDTPILGDTDRDLLIGATPMQRLGQPEEIASLITFLASDDASFVTGAEFVADGGYTAG